MARANLLVKLALTLGAAAAAVSLVAGIALWGMFRDTERVEFDPGGSRERLPDVEQADDGDADDDDQESLDPDSSAFETFLILGSDTRGDGGGERADVIMVALLPEDGSPVLFSLPRDLWVHNACSGGMSRINAGLNGCGGDVSGPELMAIMVEDFTSIPIDHYARIDFEGFTEVIDIVGGVRICNDHPIRVSGGVELPEGCTQADGDETLGWVRSRTTQELVDGSWRTMPGVSDLTRNERQQEVMLQMLERVSRVRSPGDLYSLASGASEYMTVSRSVDLRRSVSMAWDMRSTDRRDVRRLTIPVEGHVTSGGAQVLLPVEPFQDTFEQEIEDADAILDNA